MNKEIIIAERFCGPPESGNGGYVSGMMAEGMTGAVEITLRKPVPLNTPLQLTSHDGGIALMQGDALLAEGRSIAALERPDTPAPKRGDVERAMTHPIVGGDEGVSFGHCFVCGADRSEGDALRIICGRLSDGRSAAIWTPDTSLDDGEGHVKPVYMWSALDCPGYAVIHAPGKLALLGRFSVELYKQANIGEPLMVCGESKSQDGRKFFTETTLYDMNGEVLGFAKAIWISVSAV